MTELWHAEVGVGDEVIASTLIEIGQAVAHARDEEGVERVEIGVTKRE